MRNIAWYTVRVQSMPALGASGGKKSSQRGWKQYEGGATSLKFWGGEGFEENGVRMTTGNTSVEH